jgi:hypothetical protein
LVKTVRTEHGLLQRNPVEAYYLRHIGKEADRGWEQGEDISILDAFTLKNRPTEAEHLSIDPDLEIKVREQSIRLFANAAGVSPRTVRSEREGERMRQVYD